MHCEHNRRKADCSRCSPRSVFRSYQRKSVRRGLTFDITIEQFEALVSSPCAYCGDRDVVGVDRVHASGGYTKNNVVPCCSGCNYLKRKLSREQFLDRVRKIGEHQRALKTKEAEKAAPLPAPQPEPEPIKDLEPVRYQIDPNLSPEARRYLM
jgi:hypothetical protein